MKIIGYYYKYKNRFYKGELENKYKNWNICSDEELYVKCIKEDERVEKSKLLEEKTIFHTYWNGEFGNKQAFSIKSLLCTQNMKNIEIWLWLDEKNGYNQLNNNKYLKELEPYIKILKFNCDNEIQGTPFEKIKKYFHYEKRLSFKADDFRMITLYKYGGVWFDLDIMFLRDMENLLRGKEFCYGWEFQPYANNALIYLRKGSYIANYLQKKINRKKSTQPWVLFNYTDKKLSSLMHYPFAFFDPLWGGYSDDMPISNFDEFFKEFDDDFKKKDYIHSYKDFFKGAYTYHWHNKWELKEFENSYFGLFNKEFNDILKIRK